MYQNRIHSVMKGKREIVKVILMGIIVLLLILCLFDMPYGYYEFTRFIAMTVFSYLAYDAFKAGNKDRMFVLIALAVLFQPFIKIALGRVIWNIVDVLVAMYMGYMLFRTLQKSKH